MRTILLATALASLLASACSNSVGPSTPIVSFTPPTLTADPHIEIAANQPAETAVCWNNTCRFVGQLTTGCPVQRANLPHTESPVITIDCAPERSSSPVCWRNTCTTLAQLGVCQ